MKKVICAMVFVVIAALGCGCSAGGVYKNADKYTMGNAELQADGIEKLDIEWLSGAVEISYHSENTIVISETSNKSLDEKTTMYYLVDGDTLRVKFAKSGNWDFKNLSKELEVWLPEGMELEELAADTVSADISTKGIAADKVLANTVSGGISLELSEAESLKLNSTSGGIALEMDTVPDSLSANTVSGDVALCLPEGADFTVRWNTVSGSVSSELDMKKDGDKYIFGAGTRKYELNTVSGNLRLEKKGQ